MRPEGSKLVRAVRALSKAAAGAEQRERDTRSVSERQGCAGEYCGGGSGAPGVCQSSRAAGAGHQECVEAAERQAGKGRVSIGCGAVLEQGPRERTGDLSERVSSTERSSRAEGGVDPGAHFSCVFCIQL